jgi:hypothetical protein
MILQNASTLQLLTSSYNGEQGYKDTRIQGYKDTRIQGYKDTRIQGYYHLHFIHSFSHRNVFLLWIRKTLYKFERQQILN